ncbi:DNA double-strand break repair nuclease NurA [Tychonema sp. LEGE 07199]|uniref:DNA double-strand break repair nuclease NurA n=1 Tax=unclassified Tychonema TaxID=2642144 RepID=UPI00187E8518|nr:MULTISPECIES: DNA double-strand break repair nuclease NurA [unclassified Tychonema]MBE9123442.1 DNA double-strand break repair nuclease NurA [Tychonema sp. LEGE 07199]MBE9134947.1 DNA double-strand break repair nuclease NurA [Tychonema sp. LEGE 07196]
MLDLTKAAKAMHGMSQHLNVEAAAARQRLEVAQNLLAKAAAGQDNLVELQESWRDRTLFNAATPIEPLGDRTYITAPPAAHTVFATDGSQISPNHHEIAYCYLLNIGTVMLHYGQSRHPVLDSVPEVFYKPEDLYASRQWGIRTEEWMGYRRAVSEAIALAEMGCDWAKVNNNKLPVPALAMVDGSLIYWFLEQLPSEARDLILQPILEAWDKLRLAKIPLLGYLSASRSSETLSFLRFQACTHEVPDCMTNCPNVGFAATISFAEKAPCQVFEPLRDAILWATVLSPGQRSPLWKSQARILDLYGLNTVYFCYVHVGTEIARIEVPEWVAQDAAQLDLTLGMMLAQVHKGGGYPVTLAEAHNQAVVTGGDRTRFFALLEQQMIKAGLKNVGISYKETRKRGSIA